MFRIVTMLALLVIWSNGVALRLRDIDRTGTVYVSPKLGFSFPVGALADANYTAIAASWRKEGTTLSGDVGYYVTSSTVAGLEISYSTFKPRSLSAIQGVEVIDQSRVRIRRVGLFLQYSLIASGKYRPFMKLGAGLFEITRISMPSVTDNQVEYRDYTLGAKPVGTVGFGVHANVSSRMSTAFSIEAVWLNSFGAAWETQGRAVGPLRKNMLFFPVYLGLIFHLSDE